MNSLLDIEKRIRLYHGGDDKQLEIIFANQQRLIVEAPAGCGKTTTMVSRIAYLLARNTVPTNKKILALAFSVNAAYKMKKDIAEKLPKYGIEDTYDFNELNKRIYVSNYHGLCRRILSLYGYLIDDRLTQIDDFKAFNECAYRANETFDECGLNISNEEKMLFEKLKNAVLNCDANNIDNLEDRYIGILKEKFFSHNCITYNGYLILTRRLLVDNTELLSFYQKLYHTIIIDEFQDTNYLSWRLICTLITDDTNLFFMGDSLQRIFGFIGAIPKLIDEAEKKFMMYRIEMNQNYRFKNNTQMLFLDHNIRENAKSIYAPKIERNASINFHYAVNHESESNWIVTKVKSIQKADAKTTTAILILQRGNGINTIMEKLADANIDFFYALFSDEDDEYILFHKKALRVFYEELERSVNRRINKTFLRRVFRIINNHYKNRDRLIESLLSLVTVFFERVCSEYKFLDNEEKITLISETFENRALKQNMDLINSKLFVSTVHGAKGLEWDNVIIPDLEPFCFPNYSGLCKECIDKKAQYEDNDTCKIDFRKVSEKAVLEELSVFYVAVTRARKQLFFSASKERINAKGHKCDSRISCLAFLPGICINFI